MGCRTRKYSDGGKVLKSEYGEPTFTRSLLEKVGIGDGYGNPKKAPKQKRMDVSNVTTELANTVAKRKKVLDDL